jgi:hypothetical protein
MQNSAAAFARRHKQVRKKHRKMAFGYRTKVDENGVFIQKPTVLSTTSMRGPFVFFIAFLIGMKVLFQTYLGEVDYLSHVDSLAGGNLAEKVGAFIMAPDPVTSQLASVFSNIL